VDAKPVERTCGETLGRSIGVACEDGAGEVRVELLHGAHRAPEHALAAAAVVRVRVEESRGRHGVTSEKAPERGAEERGEDGEEADRHDFAGAATANLVGLSAFLGV